MPLRAERAHAEARNRRRKRQVVAIHLSRRSQAFGAMVAGTEPLRSTRSATFVGGVERQFEPARSPAPIHRPGAWTGFLLHPVCQRPDLRRLARVVLRKPVQAPGRW